MNKIIKPYKNNMKLLCLLKLIKLNFGTSEISFKKKRIININFYVLDA